MAASEKKTDEKRYDRQLRLWGEEGQKQLESAKICLLNASAVGTETLKNLVLPGVGSFTIVDDHKVDEADMGQNFFVDASSLGKSRAAVTRELLNELNDLVTSEAIEKNPVALIHENPNFFTQFTLVIATNLPEEPLRKLAAVCYQHNVGLLSVRSYGLLGYIRFVVPEHTITETKPDNPPDDLRLANPFPELQQYADSIDMSKLDSTEHSHVPYVVLLVKYLTLWKNEHGGKLPSTYAEKNEFRNIVIRGAKKPDEENFNEAYKNALKACAVYTIPSYVRDVLNDAKAAHLTADSSPFWILAHALKGFVENEGGGFLPVPGSLSDMTATTEGYINLQNIYRNKAMQDAAVVIARVKQALAKLGKPEDFISEEEIRKFCKNCNFLRVIRYRSLEEERNPSTAKTSLFATQLATPEDPSFNIVWYFMFRAVDRFYTQHNRYPGNVDAHVDGDVEHLKGIVQNLLQELSITTPIDEKYVRETVRFGASELHPISSLIGGVASQEVIKAITHLYTAMNNTFIFNGLNSTSLTVDV